MARRDTYIAIMVAAAKGHGVRLSADEVFQLSHDDAIATRAANGLEDCEWPGRKKYKLPGWARINPWRKRTAAGNLTLTDPSKDER